MRAQLTGLSALTALTVFLPVVASAQTIEAIISRLSGIFNGIIALFVTLAIVVFFWGLVKYLTNSGDEMAKEGINLMFWGIVALFVMISVWGIVILLQRTFGVGNARITAPQGPSVSGGGAITVPINIPIP